MAITRSCLLPAMANIMTRTELQVFSAFCDHARSLGLYNMHAMRCVDVVIDQALRRKYVEEMAAQRMRRLVDEAPSRGTGMTKKKLIDESWAAKGMHLIPNAFWDVAFFDDYGIYGHAGPDRMHCWWENIVKKLIGVLFQVASNNKVNGGRGTTFEGPQNIRGTAVLRPPARGLSIWGKAASRREEPKFSRRPRGSTPTCMQLLEPHCRNCRTMRARPPSTHGPRCTATPAGGWSRPRHPGEHSDPSRPAPPSAESCPGTARTYPRCQ